MIEKYIYCLINNPTKKLINQKNTRANIWKEQTMKEWIRETEKKRRKVIIKAGLKRRESISRDSIVCSDDVPAKVAIFPLESDTTRILLFP